MAYGAVDPDIAPRLAGALTHVFRLDEPPEMRTYRPDHSTRLLLEALELGDWGGGFEQRVLLYCDEHHDSHQSLGGTGDPARPRHDHQRRRPRPDIDIDIDIDIVEDVAGRPLLGESPRTMTSGQFYEPVASSGEDDDDVSIISTLHVAALNALISTEALDVPRPLGVPRRPRGLRRRVLRRDGSTGAPERSIPTA